MKQPKTFVYKTVEGRQGKKVEILLDVHLPGSDSTSSSPSPPKPLFWSHFGEFIQGSRIFIPPHFKRACDRLNLALISPDYRLRPQVQLQDCLEDVQDSIRFTLSAKDGLNAKLSENNLPVLDTSQYILSGSSAGGWAALLQGLGFIGNDDDLPSSPLAILALSSVTTVNPDRAPYYHAPLKPLPWKYDWPIESDVKVGEEVPLEPLKDHLDSNGDILSEASFEKYPERGPVYSYARQEGIYPNIVLGQKTNPHRQSAERFCVPSLIEKGLNEQKLRQTKLVFIDYGEKDIMVETDQSKQVIKALQSYKNLPFELATHVKQGQGHIWDIIDSEADIPEMWEKVERLLQ